MSSALPAMTLEQRLREMNEALLVSSIRQHELTDQAQQAESAMRDSQEQLRRNAETFSRFVEHAPFGIYVVDSEFRIAQVNDGAQAAFRNVKPLIGRDFAEAMRILWPEPFAGEAIAVFRRTLETGEPYLAPSLTEQRYDIGTTESYEWQIHRVGLADGRYGVVCYFFDATRLRQAEHALRESEERFRTLADNMAPFAWTADATGSIYWYNRRWYEYTGSTPEESRDDGWRKFHHPDHVDRVTKSIQHALDTGQDWEDTFPLRGKDGEYRWFLSRSVPIRDGNGAIVRWFGTNTDITERFEMEDRIRRQAEQLACESRRKDEFLATLAHELRNPLAPICNGLELMRVAGDDQALINQVRATMERQARQMVRLVEDLLDISRITRGRVELRKCRVELRSIIESAVEASRPLIEEWEHQLTISLPKQPIVLEADATRLAQVFSNLLNNAAKYMRPGGQIELHASIADCGLRIADSEDQSEIRNPQSEMVEVSVKDTGIGIPHEMLDRIFDLFTQVDRSLERSHSGLGIGLTLVKRLVEMHGGTIEARSAGADQGSEFIVRLPVAAGEAEEDCPPGDEGTAGSRRVRVLVVDDNENAATMLSLLLKTLGNEVVTAADGIDALRIAAEFRPEIILLDIGLPELNGYDTARRVRAEDWGKDVTLVALTGWGQAEDKRQSREAGFDHHFVKPIEPQALQKLLDQRRSTHA